MAVEQVSRGEPTPRFHVLIADRTGEVNAVTAFYDEMPATASSPPRPAFLVRDDRSPLQPGPGCTALDAQTVRCAGPQDLRAVRMELGAGADSGHVRAPKQPMVYHSWDLIGGDGDDTLSTEVGAEVDGGPGDDRLTASGRGSLSADGGPGDDVATGGARFDRLVGGAGDDVLAGGDGNDLLLGGVGALHAIDPPEVAVRPGRDRLDGGRGDDTLSDEDRSSIHEVGPDHLTGGRGQDLVDSYARRRHRIRVDLTRRGDQGERGEDDVLIGVESIRGGYRTDHLYGDGDDNFLDGSRGDGFIRGRGGDDLLLARRGGSVSGDRGDDRINTSVDYAGRLACGTGADRLDLYPPFGSEKIPRGPLLGGDCEVLHDGSSVFLDPRPRRAAGGRLEFRLMRFRCCRLHLTLTRPNPRFGRVDRARITQNRVSVRAGGSPTGSTLRAIVSGRGAGHLRWRFPVP